MLQLSTKKISLKSDTEHRKYARFSGLVPFFACQLSRLSGLLSLMLCAPLILHLLSINAGVKMQSILWCAWPPPGRSSTLKIVCVLNIDDIRGNTTLVANCLYFQKNLIIVFSVKFCFQGGVQCFSSPAKKISLKSDPEHRKYARFSGLVLFFACQLPVKWIA